MATVLGRVGATCNDDDGVALFIVRHQGLSMILIERDTPRQAICVFNSKNSFRQLSHDSKRVVIAISLALPINKDSYKSAVKVSTSSVNQGPLNGKKVSRPYMLSRQTPSTISTRFSTLSARWAFSFLRISCPRLFSFPIRNSSSKPPSPSPTCSGQEMQGVSTVPKCQNSQKQSAMPLACCCNKNQQSTRLPLTPSLEHGIYTCVL